MGNEMDLLIHLKLSVLFFSLKSAQFYLNWKYGNKFDKKRRSCSSKVYIFCCVSHRNHVVLAPTKIHCHRIFIYKSLWFGYIRKVQRQVLCYVVVTMLFIRTDFGLNPTITTEPASQYKTIQTELIARPYVNLLQESYLRQNVINKKN